ncbi:PREDICTED: non-specific lipid-transfer protein 2 [Theobroma cacao]|uniref:Non-specific lipid-transfer protein 2 n=1 Tax=Theobroma cacao TaxID=3641 RepID=A0AB32V9V3_THECC|nr:PREDICTED: non-specific lipid-transfer protein 2 [Theobroma cacao]
MHQTPLAFFIVFSRVLALWWEKMKVVSVVALCVVALVVVLLSGETRTVEAVNCSPSELTSCLPAITSSSPPSTTCCSKLREQKPCLCGYLQNPNLKQFVNNPNARKVASTCGVTYPQC